MSLPDARAALRAVLVASGSAVLSAGVTAANVVVQRANLNVSASTKLIVLSRSGGTPEAQYDRDDATISIRCYGGSASPLGAVDVAAAVKTVLRNGYNRTTSYGRITHCTVLSEVDSMDPDLENVPVVVLLADVSVVNEPAG